LAAFRYSLNGNWYKGNTHIHSTASDGGKTVAQLDEMYASAGYDFLFCTDHWVASDVSADVRESDLIWFDGIEIHGRDEYGSFYHVVCLGTFHGISAGDEFGGALKEARAQGGILILAHPHWSGNSFDDAVRWRFDGVEVHNFVCRWLNGKGDGTVHWNAMLERNPNTLAFACDDAHIVPSHPGWDGGWIMVTASDRTRGAILQAIRHGRFYSTGGPAFHEIAFDGERVSIRTSPVRFARLVGPAHWGDRVGAFDGSLVSEASFTVRPDWSYAYLEIEDECGRRAWTNPLFVAAD
jgi:hypothetical protein